MKYRILTLFLLLSFIFYGQDQKKLDSLNQLVQQSKIDENWNALSEIYYSQAKSFYETEDYALALPLLLKIDSLSTTFGIKNSTSVLSILKRLRITITL